MLDTGKSQFLRGLLHRETILTYIKSQSKAVCCFITVPSFLGSEHHVLVVVRVGPHQELAVLGVQGEPGKVHGAEEADMRGLAIQHSLVRVNPQA